MFGVDDLRAHQALDGETVQCPVLGCPTRVPVQRRVFRRAQEFFCPAHRLYIGRSTFEYGSGEDNLLSRAPEDLHLLASIRKVKRENRMARERSEDALTWNVFRHLETTGQIVRWLDQLTARQTSVAALHYWSFDRSTGATWAPLADARSTFSELEGRGSEPDLVIVTDEAHVWVEAKLASSNATKPSDIEGACRRYTRGGGGWYQTVVSSPFELVAVKQRRYELLRLWLLGSWAAARHCKKFVLVNLVREGFEEDVTGFAERHFRQDQDRALRRVTWESVYRAVDSRPPHAPSDTALLRYLLGKTLGYDDRGRLLRAFDLA